MIKLEEIIPTGEKIIEPTEILGKFVIDTNTGEVLGELTQNEIENRRESSVVNDVSSKLSEEDFNLIEEDIEGENEDISMIDFSEEDVLSAQVTEEEDNFDILENLNIIEDI